MKEIPIRWNSCSFRVGLQSRALQPFMEQNPFYGISERVSKWSFDVLSGKKTQKNQTFHILKGVRDKNQTDELGLV